MISEIPVDRNLTAAVGYHGIISPSDVKQRVSEPADHGTPCLSSDPHGTNKTAVDLAFNETQLELEKPLLQTTTGRPCNVVAGENKWKVKLNQTTLCPLNWFTIIG